MAQIDLSFTYNAEELDPLKKWSGFVKFAFPLAREEGGAIQCLLTDAPTFERAVENLTTSEDLSRYAQLLADHEEGAIQNAEGLVN